MGFGEAAAGESTGLTVCHSKESDSCEHDETRNERMQRSHGADCRMLEVFEMWQIISSMISKGGAENREK